MKLWVKILIGLAVGVLVGAVLGPKSEILKPLGTIFLSMINMLVMLLVFSSMTVGITSFNDPKKLGRIGLKTLVLYISTTMIAIVLGLCFAYLIKPGDGIGLTLAKEVAIQDVPSLGSTFLNMVPSNPVAALAQGNVLQIIVFAIFFGLAINLAGEKGAPVRAFMEGLADVMYKLTAIVMEFAPYGVFGIMAWVFGSFGVAIILPLLKFLFTTYFTCTLHLVIVFGGILFLLAKVNPLPFFRGMADAIALAFTTSSSSATLPVSMRCTENLGVSKRITSFVLPLGATINMNGTAAFQAIAAVFVAQAYGIDLGWQALTTIVITATLAAMGTAGIPGSGFIMLSMVLTSVGLPLEGIAILFAVDRIRDMGTTVINILGDAVVAVYVAKTENEFDRTIYYQNVPAKILSE